MNPDSRARIDPAICRGRAVIEGTRVPVSIVGGSLASGMSIDDVLREYDLTQEDVQVALAFANELVQQQSYSLYSLPNVA